MARLHLLMALAASIASVGGCSASGAPKCEAAAGVPMTIFTLYLGVAVPGRGDVTSEEWRSFQDQVVAVALPRGFTIVDANGAWMNPATRRTVSEATKVLIAALPDTQDSLAAVNQIRSAYQVRFHQQLVGMTVERACASF